MFRTVFQFVEKEGGYRNYQSWAEEEEVARQQAVQHTLANMKAQQEQYSILKNEEEKEQRELVNEEYQMAIKEAKQLDRRTLEQKSTPLEKYLQKYVIPYLVEGLQTLCKDKPEDGLDTLAELLFSKSQ